MNVSLQGKFFILGYYLLTASLFTRDCAKYFTDIIVCRPGTVDTIFLLGPVLQMRKRRAVGTEWASSLTPESRTISTALQHQWYWQGFLLSRNKNELCLKEKKKNIGGKGTRRAQETRKTDRSPGTQQARPWEDYLRRHHPCLCCTTPSRNHHWDIMIPQELSQRFFLHLVGRPGWESLLPGIGIFQWRLRFKLSGFHRKVRSYIPTSHSMDFPKHKNRWVLTAKRKLQCPSRLPTVATLQQIIPLGK